MSKKPTINIIGAGISGLCVGAYLQQCGFKTQIFEKHSIPGGLCTSWQKNGFTIDGCVHWILGSRQGSSFYKMWKELFDIDAMPFYDHEERLELVVSENTNKFGNKKFHFYTDTDQFEKYLLDLAPEDSKEIKRMMHSIRVMQTFDLPPVMDEMNFIDATIKGIKMMRYLKFLKLLLEWKNESNFTFANKLKNPFLREAIKTIYDDYEVNMLVLTMPHASFGQKSAGFPLGGSMAMAKQLEKAYLDAGGTIHYKTPVKKINILNNQVQSLLVRNEKIHESEITISAADWHHTHFELLEGKYLDASSLKLCEEKVLPIFYSVILVSFGINEGMKEYPHFTRFPLKENINSPDGTIYKRLESHLFNYDPSMAPEGKVTLVSSFYTTNGKYWIDLRKNDRKKYREEKDKFIAAVLKGLEENYPGIGAKIEMSDMSTPATILRYTNSWNGSAQGWLPSPNPFARNPMKNKIKELNNFYFCSHWNIPGGGLPIALITARDTAREICKKYKVKFVTKRKP